MAGQAKAAAEADILDGTMINPGSVEHEEAVEQQRASENADLMEKLNKKAAAEGAGDGDGKAKGADAGDGDGKAKGDDPIMIPKARFDEVLSASRELKERVAYLEGKQDGGDKTEANADKPPEFDYEANAAAQYDAFVGGNKAEVARLSRERDAAVAENIRWDMQKNLVRVDEASSERVTLQAAINKAERNYEMLDLTSGKGDKEAVDQVIELVEGFMATSKYEPAVAVEKAVDLIAKSRGWQGGGQGLGSLVTDPDVRKDQAVKKAALASQQPASLGAQGTSNQTESALTAAIVQTLSDKEFDSLTPEQLAKVRGDFVA